MRFPGREEIQDDDIQEPQHNRRKFDVNERIPDVLGCLGCKQSQSARRGNAKTGGGYRHCRRRDGSQRYASPES